MVPMGDRVTIYEPLPLRLRCRVRMLTKIGVLSFTEPYWLDKMAELRFGGIGDDILGRVGAHLEVSRVVSCC